MIQAMKATGLKPSGTPDLLQRLGSLVADRGLHRMAGRLLELNDLVATDLIAIETALEDAGRGSSISKAPEPGAAEVNPQEHSLVEPGLVEHSAAHLMALGGKRLRPLCVSLGSRVGTGFSDNALELAVAVELVHNATLLHDDVVDLAQTRRGRPTARVEYGNAASIFAGDWLLVEALRRTRRARVDGVLDRLLDTIEEMIFAESVQLENRGRIDTGRGAYFQVAEGKTAALFRWAMYAGGKAGGLREEHCLALEDYGRHLGVAFQVIDDLLDLKGDTGETGKALFTDLLEGKMTYPLIVALERDPDLRPALEEIRGKAPEDPGEVSKSFEIRRLGERVLRAVDSTGAVDASRELASERSRRAVEALSDLPQGAATKALSTVAQATVNRNR